MGFLDDEDINGTTTIDLKGRYWVKVRNNLSRAETEVAEKLLMSATTLRDPNADGSVRRERVTNTSSYRTYMVACSIVDWNLDDGEGDGARVWELNNDAAKMRGVRRLPDKFFNQIWEVVDELNKKASKEEQISFREGGDVGDPEQPAGPDVADEIRAGEADLAGFWPEAAGVLGTPGP